MKFILITLTFAFALTGNTQAEAPIGEIPEPTPSELVDFYFKEDADRMKKVFACESGLKQFDLKGNVITSHTRDFGIAQINEKTWDKKSKEMGLDYKNNIQDNLKLAKYIYDVSGERAWVCSRKV